MSYWINKLLYDLSPELFDRLKRKDTTVFNDYPLNTEEQEVLLRAIEEQAFKRMYELGVLPILLFKVARFCGCSVKEYPQLLEK